MNKSCPIDHINLSSSSLNKSNELSSHNTVQLVKAEFESSSPHNVKVHILSSHNESKLHKIKSKFHEPKLTCSFQIILPCASSTLNYY